MFRLFSHDLKTLTIFRHLVVEQFVNDGPGAEQTGWRRQSVSKVKLRCKEQLDHFGFLQQR
jgi:hypothetical protein